MIVEKRRVRKAVLPVAGLGTRLLPPTKAVPKEMLPVLGKPMIQYAVEECRASGIEEIIFVTAAGKDAIRAHFERDEPLEKLLARRGRKEEAEQVRELSKLAELRFVVQEQPLGLGHAVLCAKQAVGLEPFAVLLSDVFLLGPRPTTQQLMEVYAERGMPVVAVEHVARERVSQCGIVDAEPLAGQGRLLRVRNIIEKPKPEAAPSDLGIAGRYVLGPEIFDCLERTPRGTGGEVQLSDALSILSREGGLLAYICEGKSIDAGDREGLFKLAVELALRDRELGGWLRRRLESSER
jgi:UTP--glucose-1-phosphate uridylyltransferase